MSALSADGGPLRRSPSAESGAAGLIPPWQPTEKPPQVTRDAAPLQTQLALLDDPERDFTRWDMDDREDEPEEEDE